MDIPSIKGGPLANLFNEIDEDHDGNITDIELIRWMRGNNFEVDLGNIAAILSFFNGDADGNTEMCQKDLKTKSIQGSKVLEFLGELIYVFSALNIKRVIRDTYYMHTIVVVTTVHSQSRNFGFNGC